MPNQQARLYEAEGTVPHGRPFRTLEEVQSFVDDLRERPWWPDSIARVEVGPARESGNCSVGWWEPEKFAGRVEMLKCHMYELAVLHELAHVIAAAVHRSNAHCPHFARTYLELVYWVMGSDTYLKLWDRFESHGIVHDPMKEQTA